MGKAKQDPQEVLVCLMLAGFLVEAEEPFIGMQALNGCDAPPDPAFRAVALLDAAGGDVRLAIEREAARLELERVAGLVIWAAQKVTDYTDPGRPQDRHRLRHAVDLYRTAWRQAFKVGAANA
jgi:hypothetical protein